MNTQQVNDDEKLYLESSKFQSRDELVKSVRAFYFNKGFGLSICNSKKDTFVLLKCDRGGSYRDRNDGGETRKRSTVTRLIDCPFKIEGRKGWDGMWIFRTKCMKHNHEQSSDISGHSLFRRLPADCIESVKDMTKSGIPPRQILCSLRQRDPNLPANSRTIYNFNAKVRRENLGNRSMVDALFEELQVGGFWYDILYDEQGHITSFFFAHPLSIKLAKTFFDTFVMDCTYKINRYHMPLLDIIGVSCFNTSFYSGFAFLKREDDESYIWALNAFKKILGSENQPSVIMTDRELALMNAISKVFPAATNLLCVWHIEKNVLANCKKHFKREAEFDIFMSSWKNVIYSITEAIFLNNWWEFKLSYEVKKEAIDYITNIWLPWKEKFVSAWTEKYLHFGNRTSSRAEGAHAKLKMYLQVSTGDLKEVKDKICLAIEHEFHEIKVKLASEKIQIPRDCHLPMFRELIFNVSKFALKEIYKQYLLLKKGTKTSCTSHFTKTMGLPCAHVIESLQGTTLSLELVHPHWRIDTLSLNPDELSQNDGCESFVNLVNELVSKYKVWPEYKKEYATLMLGKLVNEHDILFDPMIQRSKGRPPKSKRKKRVTSTAREPSKFELVESSRSHNPSSVGTSQWSGEVEDTSYINFESTLMDLNGYPEFSEDYMLFD